MFEKKNRTSFYRRIPYNVQIRILCKNGFLEP